jgi:hypothetical protein
LTTVQAGDAFLLGDKGLEDHLWVILSDPTKDAQRVLLISLTTAAPHKESVCLIQAGEHPWVRHETCVAYDKAKVVSLDQLYALKNKGLIQLQAPVSAILLKRIRDSAADSVDLAIELADILSEQELVDF